VAHGSLHGARGYCFEFVGHFSNARWAHGCRKMVGRPKLSRSHCRNNRADRERVCRATNGKFFVGFSHHGDPRARGSRVLRFAGPHHGDDRLVSALSQEMNAASRFSTREHAMRSGAKRGERPMKIWTAAMLAAICAITAATTVRGYAQTYPNGPVALVV